jgi:hypothetical protein
MTIRVFPNSGVLWISWLNEHQSLSALTLVYETERRKTRTLSPHPMISRSFHVHLVQVNKNQAVGAAMTTVTLNLAEMKRGPSQTKGRFYTNEIEIIKGSLRFNCAALWRADGKIKIESPRLMRKGTSSSAGKKCPDVQRETAY